MNTITFLLEVSLAFVSLLIIWTNWRFPLVVYSGALSVCGRGEHHSLHHKRAAES